MDLRRLTNGSSAFRIVGSGWSNNDVIGCGMGIRIVVRSIREWFGEVVSNTEYQIFIQIGDTWYGDRVRWNYDVSQGTETAFFRYTRTTRAVGLEAKENSQAGISHDNGYIPWYHTIRIAYQQDIRSTSMFSDRRRTSSSSADCLRANDDSAGLVWWTRKQNQIQLNKSQGSFITDIISCRYVVGSFTAVIDSEIFAIFMYIVFAH